LGTETVFYFENGTKHKKTLGVGSEGVWNVKAGGVYCRSIDLKGKYTGINRQR
jgi:hypothetical protein